MRRLQIKFPNQIRISGWDFGSSARAMNQAGGKDLLMTYECEFPQADLRTVRKSTTERKSMSTKTTIKRIALVAVSALGLGVVTAIAPASAVAGTIAGVTVGAATPARVGSATTTTVSVKWSSADDLAEDDTVTVAARVLTAPAGSAMAALTANVANNGSETLLYLTAKAASTDNITNHAGTTVVSGAYSYVAVSAQFDALDISSTDTSVSSYLSFVPDVAGTYTILVSAGGTAYAAGQKSAIWTVTTVGAPASVTLSSLNPTVTTSATTGSRIKVVLKDAAGNVTVPTDTETFEVTDSSSSSAPSVASLNNSSFATLGYAVFYVEDSDNSGATAYSTVVSVAGSGTLSSSVNANYTVSFKSGETATADINLGDGETAYGSTAATVDAGWKYRASDSYYTTSDGGSVGTIMMASTANTTASGLGTKYYWLTVTDTDGAVTGVAGTTLDVVATQAAASTVDFATYTLSTTLANTEAVTIANANDSVLITGKTPAFSAFTIETVPTTYAVGSAVSVKAISEDDFENAMAYQTIAVSVAGRNTVAAKNFVSDADGYVTFTYTDAGTATTALTVDTVSFGSDDTVQITFGTISVGTVTVTGGATADTVAYPAAGSTTAAISTAAAGASGATTTFTATVKDANGNLLAGVPVTWTVDKATAGITKTATSDSASCVTTSAGTCTTTVFSWAAPSKVTVTATAGGKTGTGHQNFINASTDARVLSGTANGNVVIAKVVDRYGNPVSGVRVDAKTSAGYFGSGANSTYGSTDENGEIGFAVTGGNATVTLKVDSSVYTQTDDAAGKVGTTAVTASVAGTTTGTGASLSPAGVNSVAVETSAATSTSDAIDAANEATDAANAATDAANAAAEAADAATAAAQDAQAAVAELATKVASLIAGIKAQITTLTNLVIKIQKKVKA